MSATNINEHKAPTGSFDQKGHKYTRYFQVLTNSLNDGPNTALTATGIPAIGDAYGFGTETDAGAILLSKSVSEPERINNGGTAGFRFEVTCQYGVDQTDGDSAVNPLSRPVQEEWSIQQNQKNIYKAKKVTNGQAANTATPITATNNEIYDESITVDDAVIFLSVTKNLATVPLSHFFFANYVNNNTWKTIPPRCAKFNGLTARQTFENFNGQQVGFWVCTYQFAVKIDQPDLVGWDLEILNRGSYYLDGSGNKQKFKDNKGEDLPSGLLDDNGAEATPGAATFGRWRYYGETGFNVFGLG